MQDEPGSQQSEGNSDDQTTGALGLLAPNRALKMVTDAIGENVVAALIDDVDFESGIGPMDGALRNRSVLSALSLMDPYLFDFLNNRTESGLFSVHPSGRCWFFGLWQANPWYDSETNSLYVPASWTAEQAAQFLVDYAHDINNPTGKRFLAELQANGIFNGQIGYEEYNQLLTKDYRRRQSTRKP